MGSYAQCWLDNIKIGSTKNDIDPGIIGLFRADDKVVTTIMDDRVPPQLHEWFEREEDDIEDQMPVVFYVAPTNVIRDRLDLMGYTLDAAREAFNLYLSGERIEAERLLKKYSEDGSLDILKQAYSIRNRLLRDLTPEIWIDCIREVNDKGLEGDFSSLIEGPYRETHIGYVLSEEWYGYPGPDLNVALRLMLEAFDETEAFTYDLTDLVWQEYAKPEEDFVSYGLGLSSEEYQSKAKIILLTEGKSDKWILQETLFLLYPHLADYYSFMEFDLAKIAGGAGNLVNLVKAFAGSGIVNRTIAIFDNDTAAASAIKNLDKASIPPHIKILKLPEIELLRNYPTIGPSGHLSMNVNGLAASIELYLGRDVLTEESSMTPVQWTSFEPTLAKYQGEVTSKDRIQSRFREKLEAAKFNPGSFDPSAWKDLESIFTEVFSAFHALTRQQICDVARNYYAKEIDY